MSSISDQQVTIDELVETTIAQIESGDEDTVVTYALFQNFVADYGLAQWLVDFTDAGGVADGIDASDIEDAVMATAKDMLADNEA